MEAPHSVRFCDGVGIVNSTCFWTRQLGVDVPTHLGTFYVQCKNTVLPPSRCGLSRTGESKPSKAEVLEVATKFATSSEQLSRARSNSSIDEFQTDLETSVDKRKVHTKVCSFAVSHPEAENSYKSTGRPLELPVKRAPEVRKCCSFETSSSLYSVQAKGYCMPPCIDLIYQEVVKPVLTPVYSQKGGKLSQGCPSHVTGPASDNG